MPKVIIDGIEYDVAPGRNMLEAALDHKLDLPYFCWHPAMGSVGACRLCAVRVYKDENDTHGKIQMACMTPAKEGTRISIKDPEAAEFRRYVIEWLMVNHPHDCPVCDEGGECHLQDMTTMCGQVYRRYRFLKRTYNNQYLGPLVNHELNRCIQCYRCVRFYRDLAGGDDLDVFASKNWLYFGRQEDGVLQSEFSGNLVEVCPTGVFTDKTYDRHYARKWDLQTAPSICIHCSLGCNTIPGERYGYMRRVTARYNGDVNGYFLCDRGRYGYEFANSNSRIWECSVGKGDERTNISWSGAVNHAREALKKAHGVIGIGSPRASIESNFALKWLVGSANFSTGFSAVEQEGAELALRILREGPARTPSLGEVEGADVVVILGADPTNEAPMLDFAIRQAMRKAPLDIARKLKIPTWDANAVATALQNAMGKLYIAAPWAIKLQGIAFESILATPPMTIDLAHQITAAIKRKSTGDNLATRAAADLLDARQPLIVTSVSAGVEALKAAANIAWTLCEQGKDCWLSIIMPEANTMGSAMLRGMTIEDAFYRIESGEANTIIVLENDLARRIGTGRFDLAIQNIKRIIALDCIETQTTTTRKAEVVIGVPSFFEADGTFINNEGRAQRFFQVYIPQNGINPVWSTMQELASKRAEWTVIDDVLRDLVKTYPAFAPALEAAPFADWRSPAGRKVPRQPHRFSGRTAVRAKENIQEPSTSPDPNTPLSFTMEGDQNPPAPSLIPRFWWPGWNSEQSINKFQIEIGGPLHGGNPGKRMIEPSHDQPIPWDLLDTEFKIENQKPQTLWLVPRPRIFGSEELSRLAHALTELTPPAEASIHPECAEELDLALGRQIELEIGGTSHLLNVKLDESVAPGVVSVPSGYEETMGISVPVTSEDVVVK